MKKIFFAILILLNFQAFAADKIFVSALEDFDSNSPNQSFSVELINEGKIGDIYLYKGNIINCSLMEIKSPKRAKRDAKIYFSIDNYIDEYGQHEITEKLSAKYAKTTISQSIKNTPPKKVVKTAAGIAGSHFIKGFSYGVSFVDGVIENKEENRLKSGAKQVYEDSFLSFIEYGSQIQINKGDEFYFIIKSLRDKEKSENEVE